ncbi:MAG: NAD(P)H-dependent oxidoreductase [Anaerolineaceae bacterium]|nr:NAD(P)H-dependent oxidoreductase [Anaerolineaceae bacterium]
MRIVFITGSGRTNGNTERVCNLIQGHLQRLAAEADAGLEIERISLGKAHLDMCRGCRICFDRGEEHCPLSDDLAGIKAGMLAADGLVAATPVYVDDVSGLTKNWIDRLAHVCHRPEFAGRCAYLVATVGGSPTRHTLDTLTLALSVWGYHIIGRAGFKTGARMDAAEIQSRFDAQAEKIARQLFTAIRERRYARPSFRSLMTFKIQQLAWAGHQDDSVDLQYWRSRGWIDPRRDYYIPQQSGRVKTTLARLAGALLAPFVS